MASSESYNGWKNYETWNVTLWIGNDESLYNLSLESETYGDFVESVRRLAKISSEAGDPSVSDWGVRTPAGVRWDDPAIDTEAIDEHFEEWREVTE